MSWQYGLLKAFSRFLCFFPYTLVLRIGDLIGALHGAFGTSQRNRAVSQLRERLDVDESTAAAIAKQMFRNIGRTLVEILYIPALTPAKLNRLVTIENLHYLNEAVGLGHGAVILTGHFGNWEWMAARLAQAGFPVAAVAEPQPEQGLDLLLNEYRVLAGMTPFAARGNSLVSAMKALKKGYILGFLADQDAKEHGVFVNFFDRMSSTPQGPAFFAQKVGAPIVPAFIVRQPKGKGHRILFSPPIYAGEDGDVSDPILSLTEKMTAVMEERIRRYPDHWWWFQRRWLTDPKTGD